MRSIKLFFIFPSTKIKNKLIHTGGALPFCPLFAPYATTLGCFNCFFYRYMETIRLICFLLPSGAQEYASPAFGVGRDSPVLLQADGGWRCEGSSSIRSNKKILVSDECSSPIQGWSLAPRKDFFFLLQAQPANPGREKIKLNGAQVYSRASLRLQADGGGWAHVDRWD